MFRLASAPVIVCMSLFAFQTGAQTSEVGETTLPAGRMESVWNGVKKDLSVTFFNVTSVPMEQAHVKAGRLEAYNYLSLNYRLSHSKRIAIRPAFTWGTAGSNYKNQYEDGEFALHDAYVNYQDRDFLHLPGEIEGEFQMRVYAPTSNVSRERGMITRLRPWFEFNRRMSKNFDLTLHIEPDYYVQSRTASLNEKGFPQGNSAYGYKTKLEGQYRLNRTFGLSTSTAHEEMWYHASPANHDPLDRFNRMNEAFHQQAWITEFAVTASIGPFFGVLGVSQKRDVARPRDDYQFLREGESQYYFLNSTRF